MRRQPSHYNVMEILHAIEGDSENNFSGDMLKPLLMLNIESIKTLRADCKYRRTRK
jgi:hypothetical protein